MVRDCGRGKIIYGIKIFVKRPLFNVAAALLACLFLTQCGSVPTGGGSSRAKTLSSLGYESVPLGKIPGDHRYSGVFLVNGEPLHFLIDSGANRTDVGENLARKTGLVLDDSVKIITRGALGREIHSSRGFGALQIGPMVAPQFAFTIAPDEGKKTSTSSYAGQVGLDALSATGALIDIPDGRMWVPGANAVVRRGSEVGKLGIHPPLGEKILKLGTAGRLPHLILKGRLNGQPVSWVVDTGAEVSVMAAESFDRFNLPSRESNSRMIDASGDRVALRYARLHNLTFGEVNVAVFDLSVAPLGPVRKYFRDGRGRPVDGILGMDFLTNGNALLDAGSKVLYMGKPQ